MERRKKIGVLFGGSSSEHEISLKSAYGIISHMNQKRYEPVLLGITREGSWYLYKGDIKRIEEGTWHLDKDCCIPAILSPDRSIRGVVYTEQGKVKQVELDAALPVLHGRAGEDGTVQGLLELAGIPVIGCGTMSSAICMDKDMSHRLAASAGVKVPESLVLDGFRMEKALAWAEKNGYPVFVKPATEGSSVGISKVCQKEDLEHALRLAFDHDEKVILEEAIEGFEVGCAILGCKDPVIGEVDEIETQDGFFDFKEKYTQKHSHIYVPARVSKEKADEIKQTAKLIYWVLGCKGFARVDLFLTPGGDLVFNEINTIPGFTVHSRYPNMLKSIGLSYEEIVEKLIQTEVGA